MKLKAEEIFFHPNDGGCATAGFKAVGDEYVLLNRDLEPTEQDILLGLDGIHLEVSDQGASCYNGISRFTIYPEKVEIELNSKGATATQQERIEIRYDLIPERRSQLRTVLRAIFDGFPNFADVG
jgi:hypothetical protein